MKIYNKFSTIYFEPHHSFEKCDMKKYLEVKMRVVSVAWLYHLSFLDTILWTEIIMIILHDAALVYQFTKEIPHSVHCASLKYISDCLCVKSTILLHHSNGALHENDPIFPFECYINTFSMKNYAFVEHQCSKWYSNGMVWFLTYQRKERKKQKCLFWWRCEMLIMHFQSY